MQRGGADIEKAIALFQAENPAAAAQACPAAPRRDERNVAALFVLALAQMQGLIREGRSAIRQGDGARSFGRGDLDQTR
jgi:hypothetical protein